MADREHAGWALRNTLDGKIVGLPVAALHIGRYPMRKRMALYVTQQGRSYPLAYFRSPRHAAEAMDLLDQFIQAQPEPDSGNGQSSSV